MPHSIRSVGYLAMAIGLAALGTTARAADVPPSVSAQLTQAADLGPRALLDSLHKVLLANPGLAATPASAAALARAAAAPVPDFVGANLPVYREITTQIAAAAPAGQRDAVRLAVGQELTRYVATDINIMPPLQPDTIGNTRTQPSPVETGFQLGSFTLYPTIEAGTFYDSNIYATSSGHVSDLVGTVSPNIAIQSNWSRHAFYAEAGTDLTGYWTHGSENTVDWHALAEGRIDAGKATRIVLGAITLQEHEDRSSPDAVEGLTPTPYWETNVYGGVIHRFGDFNLRVGGAFQHLTFGNVQSLHGEINNHDRDRNRYTVGATLRDDANPGFRPFVEALGDFRVYRQTPDDFGFDRNSNGFRAGVGALFRFSPQLSGEIFLGGMRREYADARFKPVTAVAADGYLRWQAGSGTALVVFFDRSIEETTLVDSPAYIYSVVGGRIEQELLPKLTGFLRFAFARSDFQQVSRWDNEIDASVGVRYYVTDNTYVGVDYRYTERTSHDNLLDFGRNEAFVVVGSGF
ncbi:MAG: outer membrane beta-barrel protein [Rhodospirillales bacterium]|nr:outer membrane beta-barrel protein [Rhodospirillales bacterium]